MSEQLQETEQQKNKRLNQEEKQRLLNERIAAGKAGKLWRIEVLYRVGAETRKHGLENQYSKEVMTFREMIFSAGLMVPVDPGTWIIISPYDLITIYVYRQSKYFNPEL